VFAFLDLIWTGGKGDKKKMVDAIDSWYEHYIGLKGQAKAKALLDIVNLIYQV
jgi:hypothetical protein